MSGKLIIFSAPSGAGKSTLVHYLLGRGLNMEFSISATSRPPRGVEKDAKDYYFISAEKFRQMIDNKMFIEHEEVYKDCYYGTLHSEVERITASGKNIIFDIDVKGGLNIKRQFGDRALAIFIAPPSVEILHQRLNTRGTDTPEMIKRRVEKADFEMTFAAQFDLVIVNDDLEKSKNEAEQAIRHFLNSESV